MADAQDTTTGRSPAFQFYAQDFTAGTLTLSTEEVGAYILLMCHCWDKGSIPSDNTLLSRIARLTPQRMRKVWPSLLPKFLPTPEGAFIQPRIERERQKQAEYRRRQSDKGRASAASRKPTERQPEGNRGSAAVQPSRVPDTQPNVNSSSSVFGFQSSDFRQEQERARERVADSDAMRAGDFVERYRALYLRLRKVHYLGKPTFDFQEALQLVATFDDALLDKLAYVWLNTDHRFAEDGTRTIAKFRSMATWCQERLNEWEAQHGPLKVAS